MWLLRLKGGLELTESELGYWDNVPAGADIDALAFSIPREGAPPYTIEYNGYEEYCCAKVGSAAQGMEGSPLGYQVIVVKHGVVLEHDLLPDGMRLRMYPREKCQVPDRCFRRGSL
jgi:hypothetical protein